jgi:hypothetical protein
MQVTELQGARQAGTPLNLIAWNVRLQSVVVVAGEGGP